MNLMESKLKKILQENRTDFIDSLRLNRIDVQRSGWSAYAVEKNVQPVHYCSYSMHHRKISLTGAETLFSERLQVIWAGKNAPLLWLGFVLLTNGLDDFRPTRLFST